MSENLLYCKSLGRLELKDIVNKVARICAVSQYGLVSSVLVNLHERT